jgi:hypothetical protein
MRLKTAMSTTNVTAPTAMPAIASPRPPSLVRLIWLSAITPKTMPTIDPMPHRMPIPEDTSDQIASRLVEDDLYPADEGGSKPCDEYDGGGGGGGCEPPCGE